MVEGTADTVESEEATAGAPPDEVTTSQQVGSVSFPELVRAHYEWERSGAANGTTEQHYRDALRQFQEREGELMHAYWATKRPSAVALTLKQRGPLGRLVSDHDAAIRLHRVTDWLARESKIAELLHHCDTLAIKVSEVLRGTSERIAMQWIYSVESHLLGLVERTGGKPDPKTLKEVCDLQRQELIRIENYYDRAATKATRIVYFWGMMIGALVSGAIGLGLALLLWSAGWFDEPHTRGAQTFFACYAAGGVGAIVSVLMRMSSNKFRIDYEVGRSTIRRLGSFRPFIGAVFGVALYFLIQSEILQIQIPEGESRAFFFFGILAFLAGFNERWAKVMLGKAEQTVAVALGEPSDARRRRGVVDDDDRED
ncbi:MAG: hypothetical protein M3310_06190 [Actinomycetota bacterium]|nr:hypothetical protein [Actinomycetota bacterium]